MAALHSRLNLGSMIHQDDYKAWNRDMAGFYKAYKSILDNNDKKLWEDYKRDVSSTDTDTDALRWDFMSMAKSDYGVLANGVKALEQQSTRKRLAKDVIKASFENIYKERMGNLFKTGVTSSLGYNFYDLRAPVALIYPVHTPFRNNLARIGRVNDGYGVGPHWMTVTNPGYGVFAGVAEGQRNAFATPNNNQLFMAYKELGGEREVTFTAQFAGEGFADNLADEHLRGLQTLFLQQEGIMLNGNSGNASATGTGFKLGTPVTPTTVVAATHSVGTAGNLGTPGNKDLPYTTALTTSNFVSVAVVALTAQGFPANLQYGYGINNSLAAGLSQTVTRTNADGTTTTLNGGVSIISALSTPLQATSGNLTITATTTSIPGAYGYAWYVDVETSSTSSYANAKLAGITYNPSAYISGTPTGTQAATALSGTLTDYSYQPLEYDGLLTYNVSGGGYYKDLLGASFTSQKNGRVTEIETMLQTLFQNFQTPVSALWCDSFTAEQLDAAIRYTGTSASGMQVFLSRNELNQLTGGFVVSGYQSRYAVANPTGAQVIPIRIHPMIPPGTLFADIDTIPPGYEHSRMPYLRAMLVQRDYYSLEWPVVTRTWSFGTYVHEALQHYAPQFSGIITGVGTFVGS